jgi:hypothetical protein
LEIQVDLEVEEDLVIVVHLLMQEDQEILRQ